VQIYLRKSIRSFLVMLKEHKGCVQLNHWWSCLKEPFLFYYKCVYLRGNVWLLCTDESFIERNPNIYIIDDKSILNRVHIRLTLNKNDENYHKTPLHISYSKALYLYVICVYDSKAR
jgi:hypothetical protein